MSQHYNIVTVASENVQVVSPERFDRSAEQYLDRATVVATTAFNAFAGRVTDVVIVEDLRGVWADAFFGGVFVGRLRQVPGPWATTFEVSRQVVEGEQQEWQREFRSLLQSRCNLGWNQHIDLGVGRIGNLGFREGISPDQAIDRVINELDRQGHVWS